MEERCRLHGGLGNPIWPVRPGGTVAGCGASELAMDPTERHRTPQAPYRSIMAREERAVAVIAALLRPHGRRVIDREIILSSRLSDLLILISRTAAPPGTETGGRSNW